eukprot:5684306-Amphidinium_carterae.1
MAQAISWLEDFFNRYTVAMTAKVLLEPKEVLAFVYNLVRYSFKDDIEMNMDWVNMKNKFQVTRKAFDHTSLESLLRELIVKLRMRRSTARVDSALGVTTNPNNRPGARSLEADANEARTSPKPKKKAATPPKRKLCSSYASAKGCAHGEASEEHLVKSCTRATKRKEARATQADEAADDPEADEPVQPEPDDEEHDAAQDEPEDEEDQEEADEAELDPDNDDYDLVDPDDYTIETVDANAMNKGKGRGRGQGHQGSGGKGGRGRKPSSRGRTPSRSPQKPKGSPRKPSGLANPSARMFNVVPAPYDPLDDLNPNDPPDPRSALGKQVIKESNRLRKQRIGRRRDNIGYHRDSSP